MRRLVVSVLGNADAKKGELNYQLAFDMGKAIVDAGFRVQSGGMGGLMTAAFEGAHSSVNYREGDTIALIPSFDVAEANEFADIVIPTGLDMMRNAMVANADAAIAVGGGAGTLCEMAMAWSFKRMLLAFANAEGWSAKLANTRLDQRVRYPEIKDDKVYGITTAEEGIALIKERVILYDQRHHGIIYYKD